MKRKSNYVYCKICDNEFDLEIVENDTCPHCNAEYVYTDDSDEESDDFRNYMAQDGDWE